MKYFLINKWHLFENYVRKKHFGLGVRRLRKINSESFSATPFKLNFIVTQTFVGATWKASNTCCKWFFLTDSTYSVFGRTTIRISVRSVAISKSVALLIERSRFPGYSTVIVQKRTIISVVNVTHYLLTPRNCSYRISNKKGIWIWFFYIYKYFLIIRKSFWSIYLFIFKHWLMVSWE